MNKLSGEKDWYQEQIETVLGELNSLALQVFDDNKKAEDVISQVVSAGYYRLLELPEKSRFRHWIRQLLYEYMLADISKCECCDISNIDPSHRSEGKHKVDHKAGLKLNSSDKQE